MHEALAHLQIDHRNMRQLLRVLEEELQAHASRGSADFDLMKQILAYTLHYPNLIHHPREEALFRRLLERDPASKAMVGDLTREHEDLARLTHRFAAALHNVAHDVELPRALFGKRHSYRGASGLALGKLQLIVDDIANQSRLQCGICGRDVRPASRFVLDGHKMPLCTRQIHDDSAISELLRSSIKLNQVFPGLQREYRRWKRSAAAGEAA